MTPVATIIDCGVGNILSVSRALEYCGAQVKITSDPQETRSADYLVLPGVGAFAAAMQDLRKKGLVDAVGEYHLKERPFLGICLGMQMMLECSEEFGNHPGIAIVPGVVSAIPPASRLQLPYKIPHVGWTSITGDVQQWKGTILDNVRDMTSYYFVHSFSAHPAAPETQLAYANYDELQLCAVLRNGNSYGCQFHPEKSGLNGLRVLSNFLDL